MERNNDDRLIRAITHKGRAQMLHLLLKQDSNISQLARLTKLDRATVAYHLGILEYTKLVTSDYKMLQEPHSMGKIGRYYSINKTQLRKAIKILHAIKLE